MSSKKIKDFMVLMVTVSTLKEAKKIAQALLTKKEAACVNIIKDITSFFHWKGKVQGASEVLLIIKGKKDIFNKMLKTIKNHHSYTVPEIIALPIIAADKPYLRWLDEVN